MQSFNLIFLLFCVGNSNNLLFFCAFNLEVLVPANIWKFCLLFCADIQIWIQSFNEKSYFSAAKLAVLLCVQLGGSGSGEEVVKDLRSVFITLMSDPSAPMKTRAAAASALGDCCFLVSCQGNTLTLQHSAPIKTRLASTLDNCCFLGFFP